MKIQAAIFDMDGLMLDTEPMYARILKQASAECRLDLTPEQCFEFIGRRTAECTAMMKEWFGSDFPADAFWTRCREIAGIVFVEEDIPLKEGVLAVLDHFKNRGIPLAVATSTPSQRARNHLTKTNLLPYFTALVGGEEVPNGKPAPDIFLTAAQRLDVDPTTCLAFEDSEAGLMAAHRAGMKVCVVPDLKPPCADALRLAHCVFGSLEEVIPFLEERVLI
jgi:beta-phosphoglucomutase-like phosphatase (HAD superfamily)